MPSWPASASSASASGGPSIEHHVGPQSASAAQQRPRADPGPWWRMPKTVGRSVAGAQDAPGRRGRSRASRRARGRRSRGTRATPPGPRPGPSRPRRRCRRRRRAGRSTPSPKWAASARPLVTTEIASAVDSVPRRRLELGAAVLGDARAQLAEDGDDPADLVERRPAPPAAPAPRPSCGDPAGDDVDLLLGGRRQRQHDGVEPAAQRARQLVDAPVAVVGGGDDVEPLAAPAPRLPSSGTGSVFSDRTVMSASCTSAGIRVSSSTRAIAPVRIARMTGLGTSAASVGPSASSRA